MLSKSEFGFRLVALDRVAPAAAEPIAATPDFRDLAWYKGTMVASARGGLFIYDRGGTLIHAYRPGMELPPAPRPVRQSPSYS